MRRRCVCGAVIAVTAARGGGSGFGDGRIVVIIVVVAVVVRIGVDGFNAPLRMNANGGAVDELIPLSVLRGMAMRT